MGSYFTKELSPDLFERLKECFVEHTNNVEAMEKMIRAQKASIESIVLKLDAAKETDSARKQEETKPDSDGKIVSNIQGVLELQCDILRSNFKHLKLYVRDTVLPLSDKKNVDTDFKGLLDVLSDNAPHPRSNSMSIPERDRDTSMANWSQERFDEEQKSLQQTKDGRDKCFQQHYVLRQEQQDKHLFKDKELKKCNTEIQRLEATISDLKKQLRNEKQDYIKHIQRIDNELDNSKKSNETLRGHYDSLRGEMESLRNYSWTLEEKLRKKTKTKVPLQLYYLRNDELMMTVVRELYTMLKTQMSSQDVDVDIQHRTQASDIQPDIPVLALCINASRLGTDAASAISGLRSTTQIALLIFHHKDAHAVPTQKSERMLTGQEFKDLGGIFDLVFLRGKGIYTCDLNNEALRSIAGFIKVK